MAAETLKDVLDALDEVQVAAWRDHARYGYFAGLYRRVTFAVADGIANGRFEDPERMERLDVVFANRYLDAYDAWRAGERPTRAWCCALDASRQWWPLVLQHLLVGINAHILLDLGVAAAEVAGPKGLQDLRNDFVTINEILVEMVDDIQLELTRIWPPLRIFDFLAGRLDERLTAFSMVVARDKAWELAERLDATPRDQWPDVIDETDRWVARLGKALLSPGRLLATVAGVIRVTEVGSTRRKLRRLRVAG